MLPASVKRLTKRTISAGAKLQASAATRPPQTRRLKMLRDQSRGGTAAVDGAVFTASR
jgi:hypothetical protein